MSANDSAEEPGPLEAVRRPWVLRGLRVLAVILGLSTWFGTQSLIGAKPPLPKDEAARAGALLTENDGLMRLTEPVNSYLNEHTEWAARLLIVSSVFIDLLGVFLLAWSVLGPSLRPFVGLLILFSLRQICQGLCALPAPVGMLWFDPGFPSLLVTYGVSNDLFFSGH